MCEATFDHFAVRPLTRNVAERLLLFGALVFPLDTYTKVLFMIDAYFNLIGISIVHTTATIYYIYLQTYMYIHTCIWHPKFDLKSNWYTSFCRVTHNPCMNNCYELIVQWITDMLYLKFNRLCCIFLAWYVHMKTSWNILYQTKKNYSYDIFIHNY